MISRTKLTLAALALATLLPGVAHADAVSLAPPFPSAGGYGYCMRFGVVVTSVDMPGQCRAEVEATEAGRATMDLRVSTPLGGRAPGYNGAYGDAYFGTTHHFGDRAGSVFRYRFLVRVNSATASVSDRIASSRGNAYLYMSAWAGSYGAQYDEYASHHVDVVSADGVFAPSSRTSEFIEFTMDLRRPRGATYADVYLSFYADVSTSPSLVPSGLPRGDASITLDADVLGVSVSTIS
jgi:hypothetical protein